MMRRRYTTTICAVGAAIGLGSVGVLTQSTTGNPESHVAAARAAAARDHVGLFDRLCTEAMQPPRPAPPAAPTTRPQTPNEAARRRRAPPRAEWYAEPVKVFDNLYFVGQTEYSAWAVSTSEGIILVDTIFDYSVQAEVVDGLRKLGLDPSNIRYAVISHGHGDHYGGAKYLQDRFGTRVIMGAQDWDLVAQNNRDPRPKRDIIATDGQKLTLGDTTLTLYLTPGHTPGTVSTLIPVTDNGRRHLAAAWGGTAFNFPWTVENLETYIESAARFRALVARAGADVTIANHTSFDGSKTKLPALAGRRAGDPHPYVIGNDAVQRYLTVAEECARAALANLRAIQ